MNPAQAIYLIKNMQDSLHKVSRERQIRDGQKTPPAKAESEVDSGLLGRAALFTQDLGNTTKITTGIVVDSLAGSHFYKVQPDHGGPIKSCCSLMETCGFSGARSLSSVPPGARVWLLDHPQMEYASIIGCEPDVSVDARKKIPDFVTLVSRVVDDAHKFPSTMAGGSGVIDFNTDRPMDGTAAGEWGQITETGLRFFLDPFMAQMAVNEACGVFAFLFDNMLRLAGHNLQIRTAGSELEALNDQGEFTYHEGFTPYPWENLGLYERGDPSREFTAEQSQVTQPWYAEREPAVDDQLAFHRVLHTQGYLGQGGQRRIQLPGYVDGAAGTPPGESASTATGPVHFAAGPSGAGTLRQYSSGPEAGVFSEDILLSGRYNLRSAKAISIAKRIPIVNPKRATRPETIKTVHSGADSESEYRFAGVASFSNPVDCTDSSVDCCKVACGAKSIVCAPKIELTPNVHAIRDELAESGTWEGPVQFERSPFGAPVFLIRAAGVLDSHAFTFNMESNHAYFYHANDWTLHQELETPISGTFQCAYNFQALANKQYIEPPEAITDWDTVGPKIDHRYDEAESTTGKPVGGYYPNSSSIDLLEDGGVVISDGFGAEIRMTGGQIFLSAPGDIWMKSGRNTNVWSGQDTIIKAKNSIDITASDKDVRIKSEKNMQLLAGNSTSKVGGILIESRGMENYEFAPNLGEDVISGGVVIKSSEAPAVILGPSVYVRAGLDETQLGDITLDCNQGRGIYKTNASYQEHFIRHGIWWWFAEGVGETVGKIISSYEFLPTWCSVGGSCGINGHLAINGHKANKGWDLVVDGHYASTTACQPMGQFVWCLDGEPLEKTLTFIQEATEERQDLLADIGADQYEAQFELWWYTDKRPGDNKTIKDIGVSLRDSKQYLTEEFVLFEDRWQQLSRIAVSASEGTVGTWVEAPVPITATEDPEEGRVTYPYPGKKPWKDDDTLIQMDLGFVGATTGGGDEGSLFTAPVSRFTDCKGEIRAGDPYRGTLDDEKEPWAFLPITKLDHVKKLDGTYRVIIPSEKGGEAPTGGLENPFVQMPPSPPGDFDPGL
jgi:hypothetical protein